MNKLRNDILAILDEDARISASQIAVMLGKPADMIAREVAAMEEDKTIIKYTTVINSERFESEKVEAIIEVKVSPSHTKGFDAIAEEIYTFGEVKSLYLMSGGFDLTVIVEGKSLKEVAMFVSEKLSSLDKVLSTSTHFILKKYKVDGFLLTEPDSIKRLAVHV